MEGMNKDMVKKIVEQHLFNENISKQDLLDYQNFVDIVSSLIVELTLEFNNPGDDMATRKLLVDIIMAIGSKLTTFPK